MRHPANLRSTLISIATILLLSLSEGCEQPKPAAPTGTQPHPSLSPADVVRIQVDALKSNDAADSGIAITFRFASPGNKMITGPLERFREMVKGPEYAPMLNFRSAKFDTLQSDGEFAEQLVSLTDAEGVTRHYVFRLSKQQDGELKDCWMTDGVMPVELIKPPTSQPATKPLIIPPAGMPV